MAYDEKLADRVREALAAIPDVEEKKMFRGVTFMVNGKMCISVSGTELMCRIDPALTNDLLEQNGIRGMLKNGKTLQGYVFVSRQHFQNQEDFDHWIKLVLDFNPVAKTSKKNNAVKPLSLASGNKNLPI